MSNIFDLNLTDTTAFKDYVDATGEKDGNSFGGIFDSIMKYDATDKKFKINQEGNPLDMYISEVNRSNTNAFQNKLNRVMRNRNMLQFSIEKPKEFIKTKNKIYKKIKDISDTFYKNLLQALVSADIDPGRSETLSAKLGEDVFNLMRTLLETEIMPSELENVIKKEKTKIAAGTLSKNVSDVVQEELKKK